MTMSEVLGLAGAAIALILGTLTLVGLVVKFVLLPYLRTALQGPVDEIHKQVTVNHHSSKEPTVLDRIEDVKQEVRILAHMFDGHLDWSREWVARVEDDIVALRLRQNRPDDN